MVSLTVIVIILHTSGKVLLLMLFTAYEDVKAAEVLLRR